MLFVLHDRSFIRGFSNRVLQLGGVRVRIMPIRCCTPAPTKNIRAAPTEKLPQCTIVTLSRLQKWLPDPRICTSRGERSWDKNLHGIKQNLPIALYKCSANTLKEIVHEEHSMGGTKSGTSLPAPSPAFAARDCAGARAHLNRRSAWLRLDERCALTRIIHEHAIKMQFWTRKDADERRPLGLGRRAGAFAAPQAPALCAGRTCPERAVERSGVFVRDPFLWACERSTARSGQVRRQ